MSFAQSLIVYFISPLISAYIFLIVIYVIMGWLFALNVVNPHNPTVRQIYLMLERVCGFILDPIRKIIPPFGGLDFSPIAAFFILSWANNWLLLQKLAPMLG